MRAGLLLRRAGLAASGPKACEAMLRLQLLRLRAPAHRYRQSCAHVSGTARKGAAPAAPAFGS